VSKRGRLRDSARTHARTGGATYKRGGGLMILHVHDVIVCAMAVRVVVAEQHALEDERHQKPCQQSAPAARW
jgi:hypothetical protein